MKKCRVCKKQFEQWNSMQFACSPACALKHGKEVEAKKSKKQLVIRREGLKTVSKLKSEAQVPFNKYIRLRDYSEPCISCDRENDGKHQRHASHYRSVGACQRLRFNELNVHASCAQCNNNKSGNIIEYRLRLIKKIGVEQVEWLECQNEPRRYERDELVEIKNYYKSKVKELQLLQQ